MNRTALPHRGLAQGYRDLIVTLCYQRGRPGRALSRGPESRQLVQEVVSELDGGFLIQLVIDPLHLDPGAVVDGGELVVLFLLAEDSGAMNLTSIWTA